MWRRVDRRCAAWLVVCLLGLAPLVAAEPPAGDREGPPVDVTRERAKPQGLEKAGALTGAPRRIVALFPQSIALLPLFGVTSKVVGMPLAKSNVSFHEGGFMQTAFPEAARCPDVGFPGKPNLEIIVGLKPDLVILPYFHQSAERQLDLLKYPRFRMFGTFANLDQWMEAVQRFGKVVRQPAIADAYCAWVREKAALVRQRLLNRPGGPHPRPRVLRVIKMGKRYLAYGARVELGNELMRLCDVEAFGAEVKRGGDGMFSVEEALAFDPDYIFIDGSTHSQAAATAQLDEPFWPQFRAFREKRVFRVPMDDETCFVTGWFFNLPAPLGLLWTAKTIYPDLFADLDLDAEARRFYRTFFHLDRDAMVAASQGKAAPAGGR